MEEKASSFAGPHHYYEGGKRKPASPEEEKEPKKRIVKSKFFLLLTWMAVSAGILYFIGMIVKAFGLFGSYTFPILAGLWILTLIILGSIIYSRKISDAVSGRVIGNYQEKKE